MKILIVSKCPTHPASAGNRRFILNQVELFKKMGHIVHFLYVEEKGLKVFFKNSSKETLEMKKYWGSNLHIYKVSLSEKIKFNLLQNYIRPKFNNGYIKVDDVYPNGLTTSVNTLNNVENFDCVIVNYYYLSKLLLETDIPLKGLTTHDYFSFKDQLVGIKNVTWGTDANQEATAMQRSPNILALNTEEAIFFSKLAPLNNIYNVFGSFEYKPSEIVGNKVLLFLSGSNVYNLKGLKWFVEEIFPTIVKKIPQVKLRIGGSICRVIREYSYHPNIELVGLVESADEFYKTADIVINPTYLGTGLKIKTFESIAYDKVTIVHPHSMIGIYNVEKAPVFSSCCAEDWVNFLNGVWSDFSRISNIKEQNKRYITAMQSFVLSEYQRFFSSLK